MPDTLPARPEIDLERSYRVLEHHLQADILNASQRENARLKARDLYEERLVWESVPFRLLWEFNRRCNVKCIHCDIVRAGTGSLPMEALERVLGEIGWGVWELMPLVGGEPTLAPIHAAAPLLRRHNVYLNFITNGLLFDRAFFEPIADITSRVQFSLHSIKREVFERIMPHADFARVLRNLRDAFELGEPSETHVIPCVVAMDDVLDELPDYVDFVADLGARRMIVQKLYPKTLRGDELDFHPRRGPSEQAEIFGAVRERARARGVYIETNVAALFRDPEMEVPPSRFNIQQENVGIVELFHPGFCMSTATQAIIEWDGSFLPCIKDRILQGHLLGRSFDELWNGEGMQALRRSFFQRSYRPNCAVCRDFYLGHP
jgi:MoaA/NifB/PqqE/SkfB family radical SAM enzyme